MKVAVINQFSSAGGGARFARALVTGLAQAGPGIEIELFADAANLERDSLDEVFANLPQVRVVPVANGLGTLNALPSFGRMSKAYGWLRGRLKRIPLLARAYYAHRMRAGVAAPRWAGFALDAQALDRIGSCDVAYLAWPYFIEPVEIGVPLVCTMHDFNFKYPFGNFAPPALAIVERQVPEWISRSSAVIVSSAFMKDEIGKFYPGRARTVHEIPLTSFSITSPHDETVSEARARYGLPADYMICASNTSSHKNLVTLLRAAGELKRRGMHVPVVFAGHGTDNLGQFGGSGFTHGHPLFVFQQLTAAMKDGGLTLGSDVFGLGYVSDRDIDALIRGARLVVSPSLYEAGSGPGLDAWASGTPVAFSDIPPFVEHLSVLDTEAWVFDPHDPVDMADVIAKAIADPQRAAGMAQRSQAAISRRTWKTVGHEYLRVFEAVVAG